MGRDSRVVMAPQTVAFGANVAVPDGCSLVEVLIPAITSATLTVEHTLDKSVYYGVLADVEKVKTFPLATFTGDISLIFRCVPGGFVRISSSETQTATMRMIFHS